MNDKNTLEEQLTYYRARAPEYDEWFMRTGRYDRGPEHRAEWFSEVAIMEAALESVVKGKQVLELACGTGRWTKYLARWAAHTLAVDAAAEALQINENQIRAANVEYIQADLFSWRPDKSFDVVFFSFWLSHIPPQRFAPFWQNVSRALKPDGCVFFMDSLFEQASTARDHVQIDKSGFAQRKLNDGREFRIVKVFYEPVVLEKRLRKAGWHGWVRTTGKYFFYGCM
ncbi:MAG TPA: class I SAM-dependent methyltransferase, partial [Pyrinomonadaceae bacterium]|nr:class I SAM-dependent methyltransferase [Pyrinomonadaceae bacterium]